MKVYLAGILLGLGAVVWVQGVLVWDGSYLFVETLERQAPLIPHSRWIVLPPQMAVLLLSHFTQDVRLLVWVFGGVYALLSLCPLLASARLLPREDFLAVAWAYSSTTLAGQFPLYSESTLTVQFFWGLLAGLRAERPLVAYFFAALMLISHPVAILFLGVAVWIAPQRRVWWLWLAVGLLRFALLRTDYETERLSLAILLGDFESAVWGLPFWALLLGYLGFWQKNESARLACLALAGLLWFSWARDVRLWAGAFSYRIWSPLLSLPLALGFWRNRFGFKTRPDLALKLCGLVFALTLTAQSWAWWHLAADMRAFAPNCIVFDPNTLLNKDGLRLGETPLSHWTLKTYAQSQALCLTAS